MLFTPALYLYPSLRETELELARFAPLGQRTCPVFLRSF